MTTNNWNPYLLQKRTGFCGFCNKEVLLIPMCDRAQVHNNRQNKVCSGSDSIPIDFDGQWKPPVVPIGTGKPQDLSAKEAAELSATMPIKKRRRRRSK